MLTVALLAAALQAGTAGTAAHISPARLQELVSEVGSSVETLRGLKFKTPVKAEIIAPQAARESFKAKIKPWEVEQAGHTQRAYVHLGLIPPRTNLITDYLDLAEKDVLGYYDTKTKVLYVLGHVPEEEVKPVIAHELTHALEDQHYDFQEVARKAHGDDDRATAISAVIEGSAMATMLAYAVRQTRDAEAARKLEKNESRRAEQLKGAPSFVQQSVILPYILGFTFLLRGSPWLWENGVPTAEIAEAYANPPRSTRQILHPEQYWWGNWRKDPSPLALPDLSGLLGAGWKKATDGSIGELGLAVLTGSHLDLARMDALLPSRWTNDAAIGTQGDIYHHYVNGERSLTVLLTRWESMRDAEQFDKALISRGKYFLRYGAHVLVLAGDLEPGSGPTLASAALQGVS
ncbi:MAG TPA: hypothetical protein VFO85_14945, partial [Vicinamibacteria bacterium]|nr:hypothetical protein [Vicinamibacteria bacterium]